MPTSGDSYPVEHAHPVAFDEGGAETSLAPTLEGLFRAHADDVARIVARLLGPAASADDVDDVSQQVFIAIHRALPRFRGEASVTTWIYGISTRVVLQHLRGWRRYRAMITRFEASTVFDAAPIGVEETVAQREALRRVWSALLRIAPERRVVLVLHELEGKSTREVAAALELGEEAVRSRLRRARQELEARLARSDEEDGR